MSSHKSSIEKEARFYLEPSHFTTLLKRAQNFLQPKNAYFIVTVMYDNPNPKHSFYSPQVDGRLRLRLFKNLNNPNANKAIISWKQRLKKEKGFMIERELEISISPSDFDKLKTLFEDILKAPLKGGYELYRHIFNSEYWEVTINKYPFGVNVEIELKNENNYQAAYEEYETITQKLFKNLEAVNVNLSNDDVYEILCKRRKIKLKPYIGFNDNNMPLLTQEDLSHLKRLSKLP